MSNSKLSERELAEKLQKIPEEEMKAYYDMRMKKIRRLYIILIVIGVMSIIFLIIKEYTLATIFGIGGLLFLRYVFYKRESWKRTYERLYYLKKKREKELKELEKTKTSFKYKKIQGKNKNN